MEMLRILKPKTSSDHDYDALDLLDQDHAAIAKLFDCYGRLEDRDEKKALLSRIIRVLTVHLRIEEGLFYPALRKATGNQTVGDEADVQHATIRTLMADLNQTSADAAHLDARVRSLAHLVEHHVEEVEGQIFQEARASNLNLVAIGGQLDAYRAALESRYELDTDGQELEAYLSTPSVAAPHQQTSPEARHAARSAASASLRSRKASRNSKSASASERRRTRRSGGPEPEASKGEST